MTETSAVDLAGVSKWYGEVLGLQDVRFCAGPGITAIVGPNGSGKTTLFRLVAGQLIPSQGIVRVRGEDPWRSRGVLARLGYAPEGEVPAGLDPLRWVSGMLSLNGFSGADARARAARALDRTRLERAAWSRPMGTFSGGMRQKAKLAQAIAHDPEVLILDEPFTGVDPASRIELAAVLTGLAAGGACLLVSSHNLPEIERLTDQIALLFKGRLLAAGRIHEIRGWLDRFPYRVRIVCREPRKLARILSQREDVTGLDVADPETLVVRTHAADAFLASMVETLGESDVGIREFYPEDESLEAVFGYLTGERTRTGA